MDEMFWIAAGVALLIVVACALAYFTRPKMRRRLRMRHF
jgi:hypothetical protein